MRATERTLAKPAWSETRRRYFLRLGGRILIFTGCLILWRQAPESFRILEGWEFFRTAPSPLHLLWLIWAGDMFLQLAPVKSRLALGSQKLFAHRFRPILEAVSPEKLRDYVVSTTRAAYKVLLLWGAVTAALGALYLHGFLTRAGLFLVSVFFYVCDLVCVLIWCPFRLIMKNKCCTTCRIFNWDHLMMFLPLVFLGGFYCLSLVGMALAVWLAWELGVLLHPERFCELTNAALQCSQCTDKLCTQYCRKLRH